MFEAFRFVFVRKTIPLMSFLVIHFLYGGVLNMHLRALASRMSRLRKVELETSMLNRSLKKLKYNIDV